MKTRTMLLTTVFALSAGAVSALTSDQIIADLKAEGFTRIEIKTGPTQVKAEAIRGTEKQEIVYDAATGKVLKLEIETVEEGDDTNPGIEVEQEDRDFVGGDNPADETDDEDESEDDESESDDSDDDNSDDDNSDDDNSGDDDSGDDRSDDDDSGDDSSGNDNSGNDDSGNDDSGNDDSGNDDSGNDDSGNDDSGSDDSGSDDSGDDE